MTLETKLRLKIGRYDAGWFVSSVRFFSIGRTMAIAAAVSFVWLNDALHMRTMTGAMTSLARLTSQVGSGSSSHCFAADSFKMEATSLTVAGRQAESNSWTWRTSIVGGSDAAVDFTLLT